MKLVPAKCPVCGGTLQIDPTKDAAICEFCKSPFIVEKAINNYNQTIENQTINNTGTINVQNLHVHQSNGYEDLSFENLVKLARGAVFPIRDYVLALKYADEIIKRFPDRWEGYDIKGQCLGFGKIDIKKGIGYLIRAYSLASSEKDSMLQLSDGTTTMVSKKYVIEQNIRELLINFPVMDGNLFKEIGSALVTNRLFEKSYCRIDVIFENCFHVNVVVDGYTFCNNLEKFSFYLLKEKHTKHTICNPWTSYTVKENLGVINENVNEMQIIFNVEKKTNTWRIFKAVNGERIELYNGGKRTVGSLFN